MEYLRGPRVERSVEMGTKATKKRIGNRCKHDHSAHGHTANIMVVHACTEYTGTAPHLLTSLICQQPQHILFLPKVNLSTTFGGLLWTEFLTSFS